MTSARLQRRVNNAGQAQFGNIAETFVSFGTALPSLADAKAKDSNEWKPLHEQEVFDEQGRRRLHGAFTGGWSAGYFNSVGSKEGWTPSTFKSSRNNRAADTATQTVQDAAAQFMDDEDLAELASSRQLQTSSTYASQPQSNYDPLMGTFGLAAPASAGPAQGATAALASLIEPSESRIGAKLMRRMGWREGQGVGPRLTLEQRKAQAVDLGLKVALDEDEAEGEAARHYYAPLDRPLALLNGVGASQDRGWGLGYKPEKGIDRARGDALGRTAMDDDDDDDPYASYGPEPEASDRKKMAIVELDGDDDFYGPPKRSAPKERNQPLSGGKAEVFHDGQPVLAGFALDTRSAPIASTSQLPPPPHANWKPNPARLWADPAPAAAEKGKGRQLDPDQRGSLLGETQPSPPVVEADQKSVFDYLSARSKERLAAISSGQGPTTSTNATPLANVRSAYAQPAPEPEATLEIPQLDAVTAKAAQRGFQPFSAQSSSPDPIKQARYSLFLTHQAASPSQGTPLPFGPRKLPNGSTQTIAELNKELADYAKAAHVFKPASGMLASRFATGVSGSIDVPKVEPGLYQPAPKSVGVNFASGAEGVGAVESQVQLTPQQQAVKDGNFGELTRKVELWKPASLVCKRFGVPDPYKGRLAEEDTGVGGAWQAPTSTKSFAADGKAGPGEPLSQASVDAMMHDAGFKRFETLTGTPELGEDVLGDMSRRGAPPSADEVNGNAGARASAPPTLEQVGLGDDERQGEEILRPKAPKEVFSAIFAETDDEEEDEDEHELIDDQAIVDPVAPAGEAPPEVSLRPEDVASYRPTFSTSRSTIKSDSNPKTKSKSSKRKTTALSFDMDEGDGEPELVIKPKKKKIDKPKTLKHPVLPRAVVVDDDVEMEWVEAPSVGVERAVEAAKEDLVARVESTKVGGRARASDLF